MIVIRQTTLSHPRELRDSRRILFRVGPALPVRCKDGGSRKFTGRRRNRLSWRNDRTIVFTAPASPWQNGFAERLIGSIRRECLDHVIVLGEAHLRRILKSYGRYYNGVRTHRSLNKDAPVSRPVQLSGFISSHAMLGGLRHHYARV